MNKDIRIRKDGDRAALAVAAIVSTTVYLAACYWYRDPPLKEHIVDLWSAFHPCLGVFVMGCAIVVFRLKSHEFATGMLIACAVMLAWEVVEFHMEDGSFGASVKEWHQGVEHPVDRLGVDILAGAFGALLQWRWRWLFWIMTPIGIGWWAVNLLGGGAHSIEQANGLW